MSQVENIWQKNLTPWRLPHTLALTILALLLGLVIGWLDLHVTEVTVTIFALLLFGLLLGLLQPVAAWRWAVLLVIGLPIMAAIAHVIGLQTAEPVQFDVRIMLVAFVFALLGSYIGVLIKHAMRALTSRSN